ncbi:hypothetical protein ACA910_009590 [Epithemia clementina (nom. ined.)]
MQLLQMHAKICALNGIHAASCACRSMVEYLGGLIPPTSESAAEDADPQHNSKGDDDDEEEGYIIAPLSAEDAKATAMIQNNQQKHLKAKTTTTRTRTLFVVECPLPIVPAVPIKETTKDDEDITFNNCGVNDYISNSLSLLLSASAMTTTTTTTSSKNNLYSQQQQEQQQRPKKPPATPHFWPNKHWNKPCSFTLSWLFDQRHVLSSIATRNLALSRQYDARRQQ